MIKITINGIRKESKIGKLNSGRDLSGDTKSPHLLGLEIEDKLCFLISYGHE